MNLGAAANLLENNKNFTEVYKLYNFRDDSELKDYLDFIAHEPKEWMRGFPKKYKSRGAFAAPKTAIIKLLKIRAVVDVLGAEYIAKVHDAVWLTFKKHGEEVFATRNRSEQPQPIEEYMEAVSHDSDDEGRGNPRLEIVSEIEDAESVHSVKKPRSASVPSNKLVFAAPAGGWEARARLLETVVRELVADLPNAGARAAILALLSEPLAASA